MPFTRSALEVMPSPVHIGSAENRHVIVDLTNYLNGGTINSPSTSVIGGPVDCDDLWVSQPSVVSGITAIGNTVKFDVSGLTPGYGYRVTITWLSASVSGDTYSRFLIILCKY